MTSLYCLIFGHGRLTLWPTVDMCPRCSHDFLAQGIEAASAAKTENTGLVHESPVAESDAPKDSSGSPQ